MCRLNTLGLVYAKRVVGLIGGWSRRVNLRELAMSAESRELIARSVFALIWFRMGGTNSRINIE